MKKNNLFKIATPILVLTIIAAVMAALLAGTNLLTKNKIAEITLKNEKEAVSKVISAESYTQQTTTLNSVEYTYYSAFENNVCIGYAFTVSANGYGGQVSAVVGIKSDGAISAVEITGVSDETPGLGQNAKKEAFTSQFSGKKNKLAVVKSGASEDEINAVTGATITSKAVANAVNLALDLFNTVKEDTVK